MAVRASTIGYLRLIAASQLRHLPRSSSQLRTGMLSRGAMNVPQLGQADGGRTTDSPRGTRQTTTFRNDPITSPRTAQKAASSAMCAVYRVTTSADVLQ